MTVVGGLHMTVVDGHHMTVVGDMFVKDFPIPMSLSPSSVVVGGLHMTVVGQCLLISFPISYNFFFGSCPNPIKSALSIVFVPRLELMVSFYHLRPNRCTC